MTDTLLSALPSGTPVQSGDLAYVSRSAVDYKVTLGTAAGVNTGTTGATIPLLNGANTWSGVQAFEASGITLLGTSTGYTTFASANASGTDYTLTFPAITDTVATITATQTLTNKTVTDVINTQCVMCTSPATYTSNVNLSIPTGLSIALTGAGTYRIRGHLFGTSAAAGGIVAELTATNSLSMTSLTVTGQNWNGTTINTQAKITALAADFSNTANQYTDLYFDGSFVVNVAGTINVSTAQHTSNGTSTTVAAGSWFEVVRIS